MSRGKQKDQQLRDVLSANTELRRKVERLDDLVSTLTGNLEEILPILEAIFDRGDESALRILRRARATLESAKARR